MAGYADAFYNVARDVGQKAWKACKGRATMDRKVRAVQGALDGNAVEYPGITNLPPRTPSDFTDAWCSNAFFEHRLKVRSRETTKDDSTPEFAVAKPLPLDLLLPDGMSSTLSHTARGRHGRKGILYPREGYVLKMSKGWRKTWNKRWVVIDASGISFFKRHDARKERERIKFSNIVKVRPAVEWTSSKKEIKLRGNSVLLTLKSGAEYPLSIPSEQHASPLCASASELCGIVASYAAVSYISETKDASTSRLEEFLSMGANPDAALNDNRQYPLVALALAKSNVAVAKLLLQKGASANCLLRWSFVNVDTIMSASDILDLLIETKRDLNLTGDDAHVWSMLHYLVLTKNLEKIKHLLPRVDTPTVQNVNSLGDSALTLALKLCCKAREENSDEMREKMRDIAAVLLARSSLSHRDPRGDTALHLAVRSCCKSLVRQMVVDLGDDVNAKDPDDNTALHLALNFRLFDLARTIADREGVDIDAMNFPGKDTPLTLAMKLKREDLACFFLSRGAKCEKPCDDYDWGNASCASDQPLHIAIKMGMHELAFQLIKGGATEHDAGDTGGCTSLHLAMRRGRLLLAKQIIAAAPPDLLNAPETASGDRAVLIAISSNELELACALLDRGGNPNCQNRVGESALHLLVRMPPSHLTPFALQVMSSLLESGAEPTLRTNDTRQTPLHFAAGMMDESDSPMHTFTPGSSSVDVLLAHEASLADQVDGSGNTVLASAVLRNNIGLAKSVVGSGCKLDVVNDDGDAPLHLCAKCGFHQLTKFLLDSGAYAGTWDRKGFTPLHVAASLGDIDTIGVYVDYSGEDGTFANMRTERGGYTPLMLAVSNGHKAAISILAAYAKTDLRALRPGSREGIYEIGARAASNMKGKVSAIAQLLLDLEVPVPKSTNIARAFLKNCTHPEFVGTYSEGEAEDLPLTPYDSDEEKYHTASRYFSSGISEASHTDGESCYDSPAIATKVVKATPPLQRAREKVLSDLQAEGGFPAEFAALLPMIRADAVETAQAFLETKQGEELIQGTLQESDLGPLTGDPAEYARSEFIEKHVEESIDSAFEIYINDFKI